jgi:hypothetical protein
MFRPFSIQYFSIVFNPDLALAILGSNTLDVVSPSYQAYGVCFVLIWFFYKKIIPALTF